MSIKKPKYPSTIYTIPPAFVFVVLPCNTGICPESYARKTCTLPLRCLPELELLVSFWCDWEEWELSQLMGSRPHSF